MMDGWNEVKLEEIAEVVGGGTPSSKVDSYWNGDVNWVTPADLSGYMFKHISYGERKITKLGLSKSSAKLHPKGTVLMTSRAPIGYLAIAGDEVATNQGFQSLRCKTDKVDNDFLYYILHLYKEGIQAIASGATFPEVSGKKVKGFKIKIPPLLTQRKIASILSAYDDLIENNLKRIKLLEEKAQLTYEEWFVRMKFPGHETTQINKETGLPEGWKKMSLHEVAEVNAKSIKKGFDGEIDYIDIASVSPGTIESTTRYEYSYAPGRAKRIVSHGDIIWSCVRPNRKSHAVIWNPKENLIASTGFCVITPKRLPTSYLLQFVTTNDYVGYLNNRAGGAAYPAVKAIDFKESTIVVPSENLITDFNAVFKNSLEVSWNLQNQNKLLKEARDILLPRLMTGMIDVDQIKLENLQPTTA